MTHTTEFARPIVSVNGLRELLEVTCSAANQLVDRLVRVGVLQEVAGRAPDRRFRHGADVGLSA